MLTYTGLTKAFFFYYRVLGVVSSVGVTLQKKRQVLPVACEQTHTVDSVLRSNENCSSANVSVPLETISVHILTVMFILQF